LCLNIFHWSRLGSRKFIPGIGLFTNAKTRSRSSLGLSLLRLRLRILRLLRRYLSRFFPQSVVLVRCRRLQDLQADYLNVKPRSRSSLGFSLSRLRLGLRLLRFFPQSVVLVRCCSCRLQDLLAKTGRLY